MKKITKKTLDELAKVMPLIDRTAQMGYAGGTKYYDISGIFLGELGSSDELRVVEQNEWNEYMHMYGSSSVEYQKLGNPLSHANAAAKTIIASSYAQGYGFLGAQVNPNVILSGDAGLHPDYPGVVLIDFNSMIFNHESDLIKYQSQFSFNYSNVSMCF